MEKEFVQRCFLRGVHLAVSGVKIQKDCHIYHKSCIWNPSVCIVLVACMHQNRVELDVYIRNGIASDEWIFLRINDN